MNQAVVLGASRGLGAELAKCASQAGFQVTGYSRKENALQALAESVDGLKIGTADFAKPEGRDQLLKDILAIPFQKLFYVAGGGPYGLYHERGWKDHQWALEVSFLFPARLIYELAKQGRFEQVVLVGSAVAETDPDPKAASYAAAKHALKGLVTSLRLEYPDWDLRLFSPGYMDTEMLPKNAAVRKLGVYDAAVVARELWTWSSAADKSGHKVYAKYST